MSKILKNRYNISVPDVDRFTLAMILPAMVTLILLLFIPLIFAVFLSLSDSTLFQTQASFSGIENYTSLATDDLFLTSLWQGSIFAVFSVLFQVIVGLALAIIINRNFWGGWLARTLAIFPYLVPTIVVALMWKWILSPLNYGIVNASLMSMGLIESPIAWFGSVSLAMPMLIIAGSWKFVAFSVLFFLARLQSIDQRMYQQARISGASRIQMFLHITLPNLKSAILIVVLLRLIFMFNKFDIVWLLTRGGPAESTTTLPVYIYRITFLDFDLGIGSAAAIALFLILSVFAVIYFWQFRPSQEVEVR